MTTAKLDPARCRDIADRARKLAESNYTEQWHKVDALMIAAADQLAAAADLAEQHAALSDERDQLKRDERRNLEHIARAEAFAGELHAELATLSVAHLAERKPLTEQQVREVSHAAVVDVALAAPRLSATTLSMLAAAITERISKELTGKTVDFVSRRFANEQQICAAVRSACQRFAEYTLRTEDIDAIATRAAKELDGWAVIGLSEGERFTLTLAASDKKLKEERPGLCALLDRILLAGSTPGA